MGDWTDSLMNHPADEEAPKRCPISPFGVDLPWHVHDDWYADEIERLTTGLALFQERAEASEAELEIGIPTVAGTWERRAERLQAQLASAQTVIDAAQKIDNNGNGVANFRVALAAHLQSYPKETTT